MGVSHNLTMATWADSHWQSSLSTSTSLSLSLTLAQRGTRLGSLLMSLNWQQGQELQIGGRRQVDAGLTAAGHTFVSGSHLGNLSHVIIGREAHVACQPHD